MRLARLAALAATSLALQLGTAQAQGFSVPATFTGEVLPLGGPTLCQNGAFFLDCSGPVPGQQNGIVVTSQNLDLAKYVGDILEWSGSYTSGPCPTLDVSSVAPPAATLVRCGNPVPGCPVRLRVGPSGEIGQWSLYLSTAPAFLPIGDATLLIAKPIFAGSGLLFGDTQTFDVTLPADVALSGLSLWFQGTRQSIGPVGPLRLTNAECLTILGPSPPCILPDC